MATLAISCGKDKDNARLRILAENMSGSSAKVLVDPSDVNNASWVDGEFINLNGQQKEIMLDGTDGVYYLTNVESLGEPTTYYAVYPGDDDYYNDVTVTNNNGTGEVVLNRLAIRFEGSNSHHVIFPMVATANADDNTLPFRHLTAGFKMKLINGTTSPKNLASVKIIAQSATSVTNLGLTDIDYTARWAVQGPAVPSGEVGSNTTDMNVSYSSEMNFDLKSGANDFVTINDGGNISFCIPVTISSVRYLTIVGYNTNGTEMFQIHKNLCPSDQGEIALERNKMYIIPDITINND